MLELLPDLSVQENNLQMALISLSLLPDLMIFVCIHLIFI
jgi:hypothetical protein